jgi:hypothetical protein
MIAEAGRSRGEHPERAPVAWQQRALLPLLIAYLILVGLALALGWCTPIFPANGLRGGQGIDFFCVPKAYLNLLEGRSAFDTWGGTPYGPHATWFVLHPAVALWPGGYLAWLPPWYAYGAWVVITLGILLGCGALFAHHAAGPSRKLLVYAALLASPVSYWLLFVGNVHGLLLLAAALLMVGLHEFASGDSPALRISPSAKVAAGLLLSLLSKPLLLMTAPALLITTSTRRPALAALALYTVTSLAFLLIPALNPEAIGVQRLAELVADPRMRSELNVYTHNFVLIPEMLDNAMHWLHMVAQSGYVWDHVQIYSLQALARGLTDSQLLAGLRYIALVPALLSLGLFAIRSERGRLVASLWITVFALASHFLAYAIVWEYQYTQLLVVVAALVALPSLRAESSLGVKLMFAGTSLLYLPTPYALLTAGGLSPAEMLVIRAFRVGPALLVAAVSLVMVARRIYSDSRRATSEGPPVEAASS